MLYALSSLAHAVFLVWIPASCPLSLTTSSAFTSLRSAFWLPQAEPTASAPLWLQQYFNFSIYPQFHDHGFKCLPCDCCDFLSRLGTYISLLCLDVALSKRPLSCYCLLAFQVGFEGLHKEFEEYGKEAGQERGGTLANSWRIKQDNGREKAVGTVLVKLMKPERGVLERWWAEEGGMWGDAGR